MIREMTRDEIPACVDIIRESFMTVADEFGFTEENHALLHLLYAATGLFISLMSSTD